MDGAMHIAPSFLPLKIFNGDRNWFLDDGELTEGQHAKRMLTH